MSFPQVWLFKTFAGGNRVALLVSTFVKRSSASDPDASQEWFAFVRIASTVMTYICICIYRALVLMRGGRRGRECGLLSPLLLSENTRDEWKRGEQEREREGCRGKKKTKGMGVAEKKKAWILIHAFTTAHSQAITQLKKDSQMYQLKREREREEKKTT